MGFTFRGQGQDRERLESAPKLADRKPQYSSDSLLKISHVDLDIKGNDYA